jgi:hypothetical protein
MRIRTVQLQGDLARPHPGMKRDPSLAAHRAAVANTLAWAEESVARGDYTDALAWLSVLGAIGESLPGGYEIKRLDWREALVEQQMPQCTARRAERHPRDQLGSRTDAADTAF